MPSGKRSSQSPSRRIPQDTSISSSAISSEKETTIHAEPVAYSSTVHSSGEIDPSTMATTALSYQMQALQVAGPSAANPGANPSAFNYPAPTHALMQAMAMPSMAYHHAAAAAAAAAAHAHAHSSHGYPNNPMGANPPGLPAYLATYPTTMPVAYGDPNANPGLQGHQQAQLISNMTNADQGRTNSPSSTSPTSNSASGKTNRGVSSTGMPLHVPKSGRSGSNAGVGVANTSGMGDAGPGKTTLWMGLENWMDEHFVRSLWAGLLGGEPVNVKMIRDKYTGAQAGFCFVDFPTHEQASKCLTQLNGAALPNLPDTHFRLNWASGGTTTTVMEPMRSPEFSLFVGDLGTEVSDDMLYSTFVSRYPSTKLAKVVMDPVTGNSRGFGFVRFHAEEDQARALVEMSGIMLGSRAIRVGLATPKHRSMTANHSYPTVSAMGPPKLIPGMHGGPSAHHVPMYGAAGIPSQMYPGGMPAPPSANPTIAAAAAAAAAADPSNTTVFIGGLSHPVQEEELRSLFASQGEITHVKIPPGKNCAFVSYTRRESAEKAIAELNGFQVGNNKIRLSWGRPSHPSTTGFPAFAAPSFSYGPGAASGFSSPTPPAGMYAFLPTSSGPMAVADGSGSESMDAYRYPAGLSAWRGPR
jgi:RNA recognition motif-containing protein